MMMKWDKIKYQWQLLPYRPKLVWDSLWIRKDEFHNSLEINVNAMLHMNAQDKERYMYRLAYRRTIAHERDLDRYWW